jgi:hypothetical protein
MTVLKGFLVAFLSFLLMLSLSIFGISLMLYLTALNPNFVTDQVERLDFTELASDFVDDNYIEDIPEDIRFFKDVVYEVIEDHEPWLKEQFDSAIHTGYDFLLGETDTLEIRIPLEDLKESVRESTWRHFLEMLPDWITDTGDEGLRELIYDNIYDFVEGIPPSYLPEEYQSLSEIQLRGYVDEYFNDVADQIIDGKLPPSLEEEIEDAMLPYFNQYYDEFTEEIPSEFIIDRVKIDEIDDDLWDVLEFTRTYIGYFKTGFYALIGFMILLIALIVLIYRNVKESTRTIGITFLVYGVTEFAVVIVARILVPNYFPTENIPVSMQDLIVNVYKSALAPLQWFSLGILIAGIALVLASIFYRRTDRSEPEEQIDSLEGPEEYID